MARGRAQKQIPKTSLFCTKHSNLSSNGLQSRKVNSVVSLSPYRGGFQPVPAAVPWMIIGDFNLIYQASDKSNLSFNRRLMGKFRRALDECELMDITL